MKRYGKNFWVTLFLKQNDYHKHSVLGHTLKLAYLTLKLKPKFFLAALLHDIGKPLVAFQDDKDKVKGTYSFTNHEEISYQIIKNWNISDYTKKLVRYHYVLRGLKKAIQKGDINKSKRYQKIIDSLSPDFIKDLIQFQAIDDLAKD